MRDAPIGEIAFNFALYLFIFCYGLGGSLFEWGSRKNGKISDEDIIQFNKHILKNRERDLGLDSPEFGFCCSLAV